MKRPTWKPDAPPERWTPWDTINQRRHRRRKMLMRRRFRHARANAKAATIASRFPASPWGIDLLPPKANPTVGELTAAATKRCARRGFHTYVPLNWAGEQVMHPSGADTKVCPCGVMRPGAR